MLNQHSCLNVDIRLKIASRVFTVMLQVLLNFDEKKVIFMDE